MALVRGVAPPGASTPGYSRRPFQGEDRRVAVLCLLSCLHPEGVGVNSLGRKPQGARQARPHPPPTGDAPLPRLAALCAVLLLTAAAQAHDVTPEDYFSLATITDLAVSADGKHVAYCEARWDKKANDRK